MAERAKCQCQCSTMNVIFAVVCIAVLSVRCSLSSVARGSTACPHATTDIVDVMDELAYNATLERLRAQLFRAFERYGVTPHSGVHPPLSSLAADDAILSKLREVLPSAESSASNNQEEEHATLYLPLPDSRCSSSDGRHCLTVDLRGVSFNADLDGALNVHLKSTRSSSLEAVFTVWIYEDSHSQAIVARELLAHAKVTLHGGQSTWARLPIPAARLKLWRSGERRLFVATPPRLLLDLQNGTTRPYLQLAPQRVRTRVRRSAAANSDDVGTCSMRTVTVESSSIDQHILAPAAIKLRYCSGQCSAWNQEDAMQLRTHYHLRTNSSVTYARCCVASSYANITVLWRNDNDSPSIIHLNKAFPASCTCV